MTETKRDVSGDPPIHPVVRRQKKLAIISPCCNEGEVLPLFYRALTAALEPLEGLEYEFVFVDDGSRDNTLEILLHLADNDPRVTVLSFSRNFGHQAALTAGLDYARAAAVICMDSDLQHPPEKILSMVDLWNQGFDVVSCVRQKTQDASLFKRFSSQLFYRILNAISETDVTSGAADFFLLSRRAHRSFRNLKERHRFLRGLLSWLGFNRGFVQYSAPPRAAGHSKYDFTKMSKLAVDAIFSFSVFPIRASLRAGLVVIGGGVVYLIYILVRAAVYGDLVQGWGSLISTVLIIGGVQLFITGLLGEYVARIYEESKGRPIYVLKLRKRGRNYRHEEKMKTGKTRRENKV